VIETEHLRVTFGQRSSLVNAVDDVSFRVERGESFGLVGESGSGKSTVLRAIAGLVADWTGSISVAGVTQGKHRTLAFRREVQMVFQDPYGSLHPRHTVDHILKEPLWIHGLDPSDARILGALREVGLNDSFRFRFPHQLSGGQRQRIAVARALIMEPSVMLLDEPTSALDVSIQAEVLNLLSRLRRERNLTYILVSHNLAVVSHMCERLAVMRLGRIVESLEIEQLRRHMPSHAYTRQLFQAAKGYSRDFVASIVDDL
jgi:peptide/nickel transport system ATP-binding protein